jgi:alpha-tubulin suppressor-like RCC1 family protein
MWGWFGLRRTRGAAIVATATCVAVMAAFAGCDPLPTVSGSVSPSSIAIENGTVHLSATVSGGSSCVFSVTPSTLGFPVTVSCTSGTVTHASVLPANTTATTANYTFSVKVTGPGGSASASLGTVAVAPGAGGGDVVSNAGASNCTVLASGGVDCWGETVGGQLGNGSSGNSSMKPTRVSGIGGTGQLSGVKSLATSDDNSYCAVLTSGGVVCWGNDYDGELGNGTQPGTFTTPTRVMLNAQTELSGVKSVVGSNGSGYTYCAVLIAGGIDCWGDGVYGQLGNGQTGVASDFAVPVSAVGGGGALQGVQSLVSTASSFCALLGASGGVDCWGVGSNGELGNGSGSGSSIPVKVQGVGGSGTTLTAVEQIANGVDDYCAAIAGYGIVTCWGTVSLANLNFSNAPVAVEVNAGGTLLTGATSLGSDTIGFCAVLGTNGIDCWGDNSYGEVGNGIALNPSTIRYATPVTTPLSASSVTGADFANVEAANCALLTAGGVDCWGYNDYGQLGDGNGSELDNPVPQKVHGVGTSSVVSNAISLEGSGGTFCAVVTSGQVDCWGYNFTGELGNGGPTNSPVPIAADTIT